ncbi:MAG: AmmeMemoRadiSam system protein B [Candidatus Rifleibacteriota bacterium]
MRPQTNLFLTTLFFVILLIASVTAQDREPVFAGSFYPASATGIDKQITEFFAQIDINPIIHKDCDLIGIIVPHAGWVYSGKTAAKAFKAIESIDFSEFLFLGVDHRSGENSVGIWPSGYFSTPLGKVEIDKNLTEDLLKTSDLIRINRRQHVKEHSIEVLLPFFQKLFPGKKACFVSCGGPANNGFILGKALQRLLSERPGKTLVVISSDWSHYHSKTEAEILDKTGIESVIKLDGKGLLENCVSGKTELCGINGVRAAIELFKAASSTVNLLERTDSSLASGDKNQVVGYAAIVLQGHKNAIKLNLKESKEEKSAMNFEQEALQAARKTLDAYLSGKPIPEFKFEDKKFEEKRGIFVTLKKHGNLRGCIGFIKGVEPLKKAIPEMAISAATKDPRFNPVTHDELQDIEIEISVLTPMTEVKDISEIQIGRDGLFLQYGGHSGLLLPQVPVEWGWNVDEFLENLCLKAGLPPGSHKNPGARLQKFSAEVFSEK